MDPQAVLDNLAPLRTPEAISWWPLAPGWWVLAILLVIVLTALVVLAWRRYQANRYRRMALGMLNDLIASDRATLEQINQLLKATSLACWPAADVAQLHGANWTAFLRDSIKRPIGDDAFSALEDVYKAPHTPANAALIQTTRIWLKHHRRQHA